jgi:hypothetical protein
MELPRMTSQEMINDSVAEADTRMILHAIHADKTFGESGIKGRIIVKSPDTDFLILCIHFFPSMQHTQEFSFPFWSYSRQTSLLAASIDLPVSQSAWVDKSLKFSGLSLSTLKTVRLPPMKSAVLFGWEDRNGLVPVYFKDQMSSDFLQDLVCTCKGKSVCMKGCICFEQSLSCTDLCPCQAEDCFI